MKTALVLTGHLRTFFSNYPFFEENVIKRYKPDIYMDLWDTFGYWDDNDDLGFKKESELIDIISIKNKLDNLVYLNVENYSDKRYEFEQRAKQFERIKVVYPSGGTARPINVISMWFKRYQAIQNIQYEYDKVILTRPDIRISEPVNLGSPLLELCNSHNDSRRGFADIYFAGSLKQIQKVVEVYNNFEIMIFESNEFCGHSAIKWWLNRINIPFDVIRYNMSLFNTPEGYCKK